MRYLSINKNQGVALSLALAAASFGLNQLCWAQQSTGQSGSGQPPQAGQPTKATMTPKEAAAKMREVPKSKPNTPKPDIFGKPELITADKAVFDDIPPYTGKAKFQTGAVFAPGGQNGALMVVTYTVAEPKSQVKDWYTNALRMYGWNITFQSDTAVSAVNSKSGNTCALQFCDEDKTKKGQSLLQIDYHRAMH